ncbi:hypothetical protein B0H34DRAFT_711243 [Crassisporium funariophilum]|nr:hypothetical protein B0H34DRAFT_711243 [Crassisporium funariophilum]
MLPFSLKIVWFVLSFTGAIACWIVLHAFGRAVGNQWGPVMYSIGNTLLQGIFCLGMIYRMDPFQMPKSFCIVQVILVGFGGFLITGVCLAFSLATSMAVLKPKTWADGQQRALKWRNIYIIPTIAFPLIASIIHIVFLFKFDPIHPTDDMHCDATDPEWVRFLGYAGVPLLLSLPSLYLSIRSITRVYKTYRHLQRARSDSVDGFTSMPRNCRKLHFQIPTRAATPSKRLSKLSTHSTTRREQIAPSISSPVLMARQFHLPFKTPPMGPNILEGRESSNFSANFSTQDKEQDDNSSRVSMTFPTFANPGPEATPITEARSSTTIPNHSSPADGSDWQSMLPGTRASYSFIGHKEWAGDEVETHSKSDCGREDYVMNDEETYPHRPGSITLSSMEITRTKSKREPPNLAPALWRILLFQVCFTSVQFLTCISTFIDIVTHRPTPSPLGTHHFALLLAAWGPVIVFGHLPAVRRNLIPWREKS